MTGPRLRHPGRDYLLFSGPLLAATEVANFTGIGTRSPNLLWPIDRSWFVATDIDLDSTIVAGSSELIADVLAEPVLEAWSVTRTIPRTHDGDTVNI